MAVTLIVKCNLRKAQSLDFDEMLLPLCGSADSLIQINWKLSLS